MTRVREEVCESLPVLSTGLCLDATVVFVMAQLLLICYCLEKLFPCILLQASSSVIIRHSVLTTIDVIKYYLIN